MRSYRSPLTRLPSVTPLLVLTAALLVLTPLIGCTDRASARGRNGAPSVPHGADALAAVRLSPLYREAQRDCRAHHYPAAADALRRLSATPGLTADQAAFCREQRDICLHDAGMPADVPRSLPPAPQHNAATASSPLRTPDRADCGPRALAFVCESLLRPCSLPALRSAAGTTEVGTTLAGLAAAAGSVGLRARGEQVDLLALKHLPGPAVAWVDGDHYVAVLSVDGNTATIHDPNHAEKEEVPTRTLLARSGGVLLTLTR